MDFWADNFKVLVEARCGALHIKTTGEYYVFALVIPLMRREVCYQLNIPDCWSRLQDCPKNCQGRRMYTRSTMWIWASSIIWVRKRVSFVPIRADNYIQSTKNQGSLIPRARDRQRYGTWVNDCKPHTSCQEPGQARHASIGSFPTGSAFNLGRNLEVGSGSHKSSLFPWDNAGISSSAAGVQFEMGSDRFSLGQDDVRLKDASVGRSSGREGSLVPSQLNSGPGTLGFSPRTFEKIGTRMNDSFEFDGRKSMVLAYNFAYVQFQFQRGVPCKETLLGWSPI